MSVSEIIGAASQIEKLGIVGLLAMLNIALAWTTYYFRQQLGITMARLERAKAAFIVVKIAADSAGAQYNLDHLRGIDDLISR